MTIKKEQGALRRMFAWCEEQGLMNSAPVVPRIARKTTGTAFRLRRRGAATRLEASEVEALLAALPEFSTSKKVAPFPVRARFIVQLETALRPATVAALRVPENYVRGDGGLRILATQDKERFAREVPVFAKMLSNTTFGAVAGSRIWGPNIAAAVDTRLASSGDDPDGSFDLPNLLTFAPVDEARRILVRNWERIRHIADFVQIALILGGAELEPLVRETIAAWPTEVPNPFQFAVMRLETGFEGGLVVPVDKDRLAGLLPYANRLGEFDLLRLAELARKHGLAPWGRTHIGPLLEESHRAQVFPTESDLRRALDRLIQDESARRLRTVRFAEMAEERSDGCYDPLDVLDDWLSENRSEAALEIAAYLIVGLGRRSGIDIFARHIDMSREAHRQRLADVEVQVRRGSL